MTDLEKMREWLKTFPGTAEKPNNPDNFTIDHIAESAFNAGLHSNGALEIAREEDIAGNVTLTLQYSFNYSVVLEKDPSADEIAAHNAEYILAFQNWVMEESLNGRAPKFGNIDMDDEIIRAQNGMFASIQSEGSGLYSAPITVRFRKYYSAGGQ
jgi:hypothetical protein